MRTQTSAWRSNPWAKRTPRWPAIAARWNSSRGIATRKSGSPISCANRARPKRPWGSTKRRSSSSLRAPLHVGYGNLLLVAARHDLAAVQYEKALELDPDCAAAFFNLGSARQHLYQSEEAQRLFQRAAELSPHKPLWRLRRSAASPVLFRDMQQIDAWRGTRQVA